MRAHWILCLSLSACLAAPGEEPQVGTSLEPVLATSPTAHHSHVGPSTWHRTFVCTECHNPRRLTQDGGPGVEFGPFARTTGLTPVWNGTSCSNVYCHGASLPPGGTNTTPTWRADAGTQATCGTCHSLPPGGSHPPAASVPPSYRGFVCAYCHSPVLGVDGGFINPALHINGAVNLGPPPCQVPCP